MASSAILHLLHAHRSFVKFSVILLFFIVSPPLYAERKPYNSIYSRRALVEEHQTNAAAATSSGANSSQCGGNGTRGPLFNYAALHYCYLKDFTSLSVTILVGIVVLQFYVLAAAAELHFSRVVSRLAALLRLSPSMGGVTVLALGNGAPDLFASMAALRSDNARIGLGAILSAGAFVSAFVVGNVALTAAPFSVKPFPFVRDVFFYLTAATTLFYVYLTGVIFLWQAVGLVLFYFFFVAVVFWTDRVEEIGGVGDSVAYISGGGFDCATRVNEGLDKPPNWKKAMANAISFQVDSAEETKAGTHSSCWICGNVAKFTQLWELPVKLVLKLLIPSICSSEWSRFYSSANILESF
ncbi:hypothetical protein SUGI_0109410 [Cryptomeria japonica]|uniref:cation/calcium exchanger 5 isoform X2 n=1 Tax=Cryptomeria japonica TaxID=3369 RepID=UPI002408A4B8|nr:cation/calcium exchanger 5 isoform X2 [Cryptomeria japonica]GLJ09422.1 hypothetical protein SUGI_0109410 [Cryptomeria japonica]